jgi:hypothetical protein
VASGDVPNDQVTLNTAELLVRAPVSQKCGFQAIIQAMADAEQSSFKIPVEQLSTEGVELLNQACQDEVLISSGTIRMQTSAGALLSLAEVRSRQACCQMERHPRLMSHCRSGSASSLHVRGGVLQAGINNTIGTLQHSPQDSWPAPAIRQVELAGAARR